MFFIISNMDISDQLVVCSTPKTFIWHVRKR